MYTPLPAVSSAYLQGNRLSCLLDERAGGSVAELRRTDQPSVLNALTAARQTGIIIRSGPVPYQVLGFPLPASQASVGWTAAQATDGYDSPNPVDFLGGDGTTRYVRTGLLLQTAAGHRVEALLQQWYWIEGIALRVHGKLVLNRSDTTAYPARVHQLPLVYLTGRYHRPIYYGGAAPFQDDAVSRPVLTDETRLPVTATENWVGLSDFGGQCVGLWGRGQTSFELGFLGVPSPRARSTDYPAGYLAITPSRALAPQDELTYDYALIPGTEAEIRSWVYQQPRHYVQE